MRVLWDSRSIAPHMGGIGRAAAGWLKEFLRLKPSRWHVVALFSGRCRPEDVPRLVPGADREAELCFAEAGMIAPRFEQLALPALLERHRIDLYFNPCFSIPAIKTTRFQASVVHDVVFLDHPEWVDERLRKYLEHGSDLALRRADAVFTVSEYSRKRIQELAGARGWDAAGEVAVVRPSIPNAVRAEAGSGGSGTGASGLDGGFLLYLGSVERKKGAAVLLDAYGRLRRRLGSQCPGLVLAGGTGGQGFDVQEELRRRGLEAWVRHLGVVSEKSKCDLLRGAKAFVFPSLYEGFGIPPLEAMAFGTPVVAARSTSLPEVLGDAALFTEPGDVEELVAGILRVLGDPESREALVRKGKARAARYTWAPEVRKLVLHFERLEKAA